VGKSPRKKTAGKPRAKGSAKAPRNVPVPEPPGTPDVEPDPGWYPVGEIAEIFDVSPQAWHQTYRALIRPGDIKEGAGNRILIRARGAIDAWVEHKVKQSAPPKPPPGEDPDIWSNADSPALEKYRAGKAELVWMEVRERERSLIKRALVHEVFGRMGSALRQRLEALQRAYGPDAYEIVDEGLRACLHLLIEAVPPEQTETPTEENKPDVRVDPPAQPGTP
jgi:hypothetical protein